MKRDVSGSTTASVESSPVAARPAPRGQSGIRQQLAKAATATIVLLLCLGLGVWSGPWLQGAYKRLFPEPAYIAGNYEAVYRQAGKPVVMFSKSTCPYCVQARALLERENIVFEELIVDQSPAARQQFDQLQGGSVPMLFIGDRRIVGFRENTIRESLALIRR